jgi:hypothetical protein
MLKRPGRAEEVAAARIEALKAEAIRRELRLAEGEAYRIVLTPPGTAQRHRDDMAGNAAPRAGCVRPAGGFRPRSDLFQIASPGG